MPQYRRPSWRAIVFGLALLLAGLSLAVSLDSRLDRPVVISLSATAAHSDGDLSTLTDVANDTALVGVAGAAMLVLIAAGQRRLAILVAATFGLTEISTWLLSAVIDRPGPAVGAFGSSGRSFPSDPAAELLAVYGVLALLLWRWVRGRGRLAIIFGLVAPLLAVSAAPVYLGTQYPSDVVAGWLTAAIAASIAWGLLMPSRPQAAGDGGVWAHIGQTASPGAGEGVARLPGLRSTLKRVPGAVRSVHAARRWRRELNAVAHTAFARAVDLLAGVQARERFRSQSVLQQPARLPIRGELGALAASLVRQGMPVRRAPSSIHIAPSSSGAVLGEVAELYGADATFKITGQDGDARRSLLAANLLHMRGLGPRVYDAFSITDRGKSRAVFALQGAFEGHVSAQECAPTVASLSGLFESGELSPVGDGWEEAEHFRPPNGEGAEAAWYVGLENLSVPRPQAFVRSVLDREARKELHYGDEYALKGGRYLYQSIPAIGATGRRNSLRRWTAIRSMLHESGIGFENRLVLDIACNAGMMMAAALAEGASWAIGWDLPEVAARGRNLLLALGYTRFEMVGADLVPHYPLEADVPEQLRSRLGTAVVLNLAFRHNVGYFLSSLGDVPWAAMVYEGGEEERAETTAEYLEELRGICDFEVAATMAFRDGETRERPLLLLLRS